MRELDEYEYLRFINPSNLFIDETDFKRFIEIRAGLTDDEYREALEYLLGWCEREELFEYCQIIKNKLQ